ncbi:hypothetical protein MMC07_005083 [Pseudocyphellaria aurata]|nr:hypothetical protein [Pseudocyphellaria aurata]
MKSTPPHHLTYAMMHYAMLGLIRVLMDGRNYCDAEFVIFNGNVRLGDGYGCGVARDEAARERGSEKSDSSLFGVDDRMTSQCKTSDVQKTILYVDAENSKVDERPALVFAPSFKLAEPQVRLESVQRPFAMKLSRETVNFVPRSLATFQFIKFSCSELRFESFQGGQP